MNDYRNVLVHVSDSERSRQVLSCAAMVAAAQGASLRAVHAVEPLYLGVGLSPESAMTAPSSARRPNGRARQGHGIVYSRRVGRSA